MRTFMIALRLFVVLTVLTGLAYPLLITGIAQGAFPAQANGSLVVRGGKVVGSRLIGQSFDDPRYFWGRPSATSGFAYNAALSGGSNLGPTNPALMERIEARGRALRSADPENAAPIPTELVTASASGLDPHISPEAANFQVARVAHARGLSKAAVQALVDQNTQRPVAGLGEPVVNVLELNLDLDKPNH